MLKMREVVVAVEECFRQEAAGRASNAPRSKLATPGTVFSSMHASLPYLGRAGLKAYVSTRSGTEFYLLLFDLASGELLAAMGADYIGRFRTGAVSAVATRHLCPLRSFDLAIAGSGRQAFTQATAISEVAEVGRVLVWSPRRAHARAFASRLSSEGFDAVAKDEVGDAFLGAEVATSITSAAEPFIAPSHVEGLRHLNVCGSNWPDRSELRPEAVARFDTVVVDGMEESMAESGDLILAAREGRFDWNEAAELKDFVTGRRKSKGKTLFKSNGLAIEDVAVASMVYEKLA